MSTLSHSNTVGATGAELALPFWEAWFYDLSHFLPWSGFDSCSLHCDDCLSAYIMGGEL